MRLVGGRRVAVPGRRRGLLGRFILGPLRLLREHFFGLVEERLGRFGVDTGRRLFLGLTRGLDLRARDVDGDRDRHFGVQRETHQV